MNLHLKMILLLLAAATLPGISGCGSSSSGSSTSPPPPPVHNEWTWMNGSDSINQPAQYGTRGVPSAGDTPGARVYPATWKDASGNLWLFGGYGVPPVTSSTPADLNDLWKYNPLTHEWTWVSGSTQQEQSGVYGIEGVASPGNHPGARWEAMSWVGPDGNFWLYGGFGIDSTGARGRLDDLWKYDPSTNEWTWMNGSKNVAQFPGDAGVYGTKGVASSSNHPGARWDAATWTGPEGNLWLFGGLGTDSNGTVTTLNDLWKYDPSTNEWTWISGSETGLQAGIYGTKGVAAPKNVPGARSDAMTWTGPQGNLWLFGGDGLDGNPSDCSSAPPCDLNDLWKYSISSNEWTWVSGTDKNDQPGVYGTQGTAAASNSPSARESSVTWVGPRGNFWLFGGDFVNDYNDLWKYDPSTNEWTWVSGSDQPGQTGIYGAQGTPAPGNVPGCRDWAVGWTDNSGNLWLFGGEDVSTIAYGGKFNDLWEYTP